MPSLGLAWNQGQKMAQDLALGKMQTISGIAKAAMEADITNDYFGDVATAERDMLKQERAEVVKNLGALNKKKSRLASGDMSAVAELLTEYGGGDSKWVLADGSSKLAGADTGTIKNTKPTFIEVGADGRPTGRTTVYSSPAEAIDTIRATMIAPSSVMLQHYGKLADMERGSRTKMTEKEFDTMMAIKEFQSTKDPLERALLGARLQNLWAMNERDLQMQDLVSRRTTGLGYAGLQNSLDIANLNKGYGSADLTNLAIQAAAARRGVVFGKDGIPVKTDGTSVTPEDLQAIHQGALWARNELATKYRGMDPSAGIGMAFASPEAEVIFNPYGAGTQKLIDSSYDQFLNTGRSMGLEVPITQVLPQNIQPSGTAVTWGLGNDVFSRGLRGVTRSLENVGSYLEDQGYF